jgi:hypothetical protein
MQIKRQCATLIQKSSRPVHDTTNRSRMLEEPPQPPDKRGRGVGDPNVTTGDTMDGPSCCVRAASSANALLASGPDATSHQLQRHRDVRDCATPRKHSRLSSRSETPTAALRSSASILRSTPFVQLKPSWSGVFAAAADRVIRALMRRRLPRFAIARHLDKVCDKDSPQFSSISSLLICVCVANGRSKA